MAVEHIHTLPIKQHVCRLDSAIHILLGLSTAFELKPTRLFTLLTLILTIHLITANEKV